MSRRVSRRWRLALRQLAATCCVAAVLCPTSSANAEPLSLRVAKADVVLDADGQRILAIDLTPESGKALAELTGGNIGKKIAIIVDGKILASPFIYERIGDGGFWLNSPLDQKELDIIVKRLSEQGAALQVEVRPGS